MAKGSRVVINRKTLTQVMLITADGILAFGKAAIQDTRPPDAPPHGEGLVRHGGAIVYANGKKVGDWSSDGTVVKKPRALRVSGTDTVIGAAGFPPPARWDELGTVNQAAKPFYYPSMMNRTVPRATSILRQAMSYRLVRLGKM
jgi:hypothetical protein